MNLGDEDLDRQEARGSDDIILAILRRLVALVPGSSAVAGQIEVEMRTLYGGLRMRIPKRGKHLTAEQRAALFKDGLTDMPTGAILEKHKISRRTMERQMKRGAGRFGT